MVPSCRRQWSCWRARDAQALFARTPLWFQWPDRPATVSGPCRSSEPPAGWESRGRTGAELSSRLLGRLCLPRVVPAALNFRRFVVSWCFLLPPFVLQLIWAVVVPPLPTLLLTEPSTAARQPGLLWDMTGGHWKNLEAPAGAGPALEQEAVGFCSPMMDVLMCQLHLLFGAQMLLCKCSFSQGPAASSSPFPVENIRMKSCPWAAQMRRV